jgi:hypothetical protein
MQKKNQNKLSREVRFLIDFGFQLCMMLFCTVMNGYRIIYSLGEIMKDKMPKKKYIGYREQGLKCDKNGNRFDVNISIFHSGFPQVITICKKYKTYCHSGACRKERNCEPKKKIKDLKGLKGCIGLSKSLKGLTGSTKPLYPEIYGEN